MKKLSGLILLGFVVYLGALALNLPAEIAYGLARDFVPPSIRLFDLHGNILSGKGQAVLNDTVPVRELQWEFKPAALLLGSVSYALRARLDGGRLSADVGVDPLLRVTISDVSGDVPLESMQASLPQGPLLYGRLEPAIEVVTIKEGVVSRAKGRVVARTVTYRGSGTLPLGDYVAGVDADGSPVAIGIADSGGVLRLNGQLVLAGDRSYQFEGVAEAREPSPPLVDLLAQIGTPDAEGQYLIRFGGQVR